MHPKDKILALKFVVAVADAMHESCISMLLVASTLLVLALPIQLVHPRASRASIALINHRMTHRHTAVYEPHARRAHTHIRRLCSRLTHFEDVQDDSAVVAHTVDALTVCASNARAIPTVHLPRTRQPRHNNILYDVAHNLAATGRVFRTSPACSVLSGTLAVRCGHMRVDGKTRLARLVHSRPLVAHYPRARHAHLDYFASPQPLVLCQTAPFLHVVEIDHAEGNPVLQKKAVDVFFPAEATNDFPATMCPSSTASSTSSPSNASSISRGWVTLPEFAMQLVNDESGPLVDVERVVDIFMRQNMIQPATSFLLDALKDNRPEQGPMQTHLLEINLVHAHRHSLLKSWIASTCMCASDSSYCRADLFPQILEHYDDIADIKRVVVRTNALSPELVEYFTTDPTLACPQEVLWRK
ncbi:hypothetical protein EXIGLDRAFT_762045 [Exidia glandulosa HHB12029]|uniref:Uncharacterized protein n=1 Tax=Exidia glandulosa HHB12029 TaxID=1314781 RepID=A0A165N477_EXIGL|nr:hypothetical protein EXIGLDRAFT_762045 [Exidia glandulosa HHB12029]